MAQNIPQNNNPQKVIQATQFIGPIPHPSILEQYNKIVPTSAERIIKMAEEQARHRHHMETIIVQNRALSATLGVIFALIISLSCLAVACFAIFNHQPMAASIISAMGLGSLVATFIYGTRHKEEKK